VFVDVLVGGTGVLVGVFVRVLVGVIVGVGVAVVATLEKQTVTSFNVGVLALFVVVRNALYLR